MSLNSLASANRNKTLSYVIRFSYKLFIIFISYYYYEYKKRFYTLLLISSITDAIYWLSYFSNWPLLKWIWCYCYLVLLLIVFITFTFVATTYLILLLFMGNSCYHLCRICYRYLLLAKSCDLSYLLEVAIVIGVMPLKKK